MKELLSDFKKFIMRGNVLDLAVAVVIGAAFKVVIDSLVADVILPFIAAIGGKPSFDDLTFDVGDGVVRYGAFLTNVVSFVIIAASIFLIIKTFEKMQSLRKAGGAEEEAAPLTVEGELLAEIRDLLKAQRSS